MRALAIVNPRAGVAAQRTLRALRRRGSGDLEIALTEQPGHARELASQAARRGAQCVLAVGGDGTANEVAWGLLGTETALGVLPAGSGNGLARTLGLPLDPLRALAALEAGKPRRMDVGFANGRPFLNVAGLGFDGAVGATFHEQARAGARRGVLGYLRAGLSCLRAYRTQALTIEGLAQPITAHPLLITLANGRQYGGGAVIAPRARLDDGRLDVVLIADGPRLRLLAHAPRLFLGGIERLAVYRSWSATSLVITAESPLPHHRDGEPEPPLRRLEVRVEPRALSLLLPRPLAEDPRGVFAPA